MDSFPIALTTSDTLFTFGKLSNWANLISGFCFIFPNQLVLNSLLLYLIVPDDCLSNPAIIFNKVVFPEPIGPTIP